MNKFIKLYAFLLLVLLTGNAFSQDSSAIQFSYNAQRLNNNEVLLTIKGKIAPGIKLFALQKSKDDIMYSSIHFDSSVQKLLNDSLIQKGTEQKAMDTSLQSEVYFYTDSVEWQQKINASLTDSFLLKGKVNSMYPKGADYLPKEDEFKIFILPQGQTAAQNDGPQLKQGNAESSVATKSLWWIFATAFAGGLLALITPCVYSMIPVTVSFFTKRSKTKAEGIKNAFSYSLSIIFIFTLLGFFITVIFGLLGFYLLGKLKFHHDDELPKNDYDIPYLSVTRLFFAIITFSFAVYMIPGLWGAPLKGISAFVPPMGTQDFNSAPVNSTGSAENNSTSSTDLPRPVKYYDRMRINEPDVVTKYGMITYFDYDEALAIARKLHKPLMLDFTGVNCVNCRKMEGAVWSDPEVMKRLKNEFVIVSLYVDVPVDLQPGDQYFSKTLNKKITTLGDKNADLQVSKYNANTQPYYFFLDAHENRLEPEGYGYDPDVQKFKNMLDDVVAKYNASK